MAVIEVDEQYKTIVLSLKAVIELFLIKCTHRKKKENSDVFDVFLNLNGKKILFTGSNFMKL